MPNCSAEKGLKAIPIRGVSEVPPSWRSTCNLVTSYAYLYFYFLCMKIGTFQVRLSVIQINRNLSQLLGCLTLTSHQGFVFCPQILAEKNVSLRSHDHFAPFAFAFSEFNTLTTHLQKNVFSRFHDSVYFISVASCSIGLLFTLKTLSESHLTR